MSIRTRPASFTTRRQQAARIVSATALGALLALSASFTVGAASGDGKTNTPPPVQAAPTAYQAAMASYVDALTRGPVCAAEEGSTTVQHCEMGSIIGVVTARCEQVTSETAHPGSAAAVADVITCTAVTYTVPLVLQEVPPPITN